METTQTKIGRLAMRHEGDFWCAYYAIPEQWETRVLLGSIRMSLIENHRGYRDIFLTLMSDAVANLVEEITGIKPEMIVEDQ